MAEPTVTLHAETSSAVRIALGFIRAVESGRDVTVFLAADAIEEELPNRVFERGARRDVAAMRAGAEKGRTLFRRQRYDVRSIIAQGPTAVIELDWCGELAVPVSSLAPGDEMRANCAFFFEIEGGLIRKLRHYDSFAPF